MIKIDRATVAAALAEYLPVLPARRLELVFFAAAKNTSSSQTNETAPARPESGSGQGGLRRIRS
ncbi:hypothetical protein [Amycolatopsis benzoatilytica]|uniref:hypothetical protein n=1 Tax=Amycolatopsis benzoatilytica TaxID=346045 RepID=UPI0003752F7E|nr:hypothetical protein [Amycolatopsis benzoatilytica]